MQIESSAARIHRKKTKRRHALIDDISLDKD